MKKKFWEILFIILLPEIIIFTVIAVWKPDKVRHPFDNSSIKLTKTVKIPVDHSKFPELQKDFQSPQEVTETCLKCHNNIDEQLMMNEHWTWAKKDSIPGRGVFYFGKKNVLNNFCIGASSNEKLCTMCHAGFDFKTQHWDSTQTQNMDCLVCHDNTGTYHKSNTCADPNQPGYGYPPKNTDLKNIALHVGLPQRRNCGVCHFTGGGGNNVKHGDLEMALNSCTRDVDVHMGTNGQNMTCTECHKTNNHNIPGNLPMVSASPSNSFSCTECHTSSPHKSKLLNEHYNQVSCEACHIPRYAKVQPTKLYWSWKDAGKLNPDGGILHYEKEIPKDSALAYIGNASYIHNITEDSIIYEYDSRHAAAILAKNVIPDYVWWNGYTDHHFIGDTITTDTVNLVTLIGSYEDNIHPMDSKHPSKIYPVKIMRGNQIYDVTYHKLINPKLVGPKGSGAYWRDFNWDSSAVKGMEYIGKNYSGKYGFIETRSYWPVNHEVSPAEQALSCEACHSKNGRLSKLQGFYLPGRDRSKVIDIIGIIMILGAILGVSIHGAMRIFSKEKCK